MFSSYSGSTRSYGCLTAARLSSAYSRDSTCVMLSVSEGEDYANVQSRPRRFFVHAVLPCACRRPADRGNQASARLQDRAPGARRQRARDGAGCQGHAVRRIDASGKSVRGATEAARPAGGHGDRQWPQYAGRGGISPWSAVRVRGRPDPATRQHRGPYRRSAKAGRRRRSLPERNASRLEVHRFRPDGNCTFPSARRATSASPISNATPISSG